MEEIREEKVCERCDTVLTYTEGINWEKNKVWAGWFCENKGCKASPVWKNLSPKERRRIEVEQMQKRGGKKEKLSAPHQPKAKEPDWDGKDRRMVRMNVLSHATLMVNQDYLSALKDDERVTKVKRVAEKLETWIYRTMPTKEEIGF